MKNNKLVLAICSLTILLAVSICCNIYQYIVFKSESKDKISKISLLEIKLERALNREESLSEEIYNLQEKKYKETKPCKMELPINTKVKKCIEKDYTTYGMSACVLDSEKDWEKEIEKNINMLKKIVSNETYALILDSQEKWKDYKEAQCKVIYETIFNLQGTMHINIADSMCVGITEDRSRDIARILDDLLKGDYIK